MGVLRGKIVVPVVSRRSRRIPFNWPMYESKVLLRPDGQGKPQENMVLDNL